MNQKQFFWLLGLVMMGAVFVAACSPSPPEAAVVQAQEIEKVEHLEAKSVDESHEENTDELHQDVSVIHDEEASEHHEEEAKHMSEGMAHEHAEVPHEYENLANPFSSDVEAISEGKAIFETNCATCHGIEGKGDGPGAVELEPKPADLSNSQMMQDLTDGYLFWRVSKGGQIEPFNSVMPPWEASLSEEQRWHVISYVRSFTASEAEHQEKVGSHGDEGEHPVDDNHQ